MARIKTPEDIERMAEGGKRLAKILRILGSHVRAGISTKFLDDLASTLIKEAGCTPAFLEYRPAGSRQPFPAAICVSLNDTVVHGVPSARVIREGDVVKLDCGLIYRGLYADAAVTVGVPPTPPRIKHLIAVTEEALRAGIVKALPGNTLGDIGAAIEQTVVAAKLSIVESLCGHGIGRALHEEPSVLNVGIPGEGETLVPGMALAIEPMVATGSGAVKISLDDSYGTADGSLAAHFEHTVLIAHDGPRILTAL